VGAASSAVVAAAAVAATTAAAFLAALSPNMGLLGELPVGGRAGGGTRDPHVVVRISVCPASGTPPS
jgi:hypothetical protein